MKQRTCIECGQWDAHHQNCPETPEPQELDERLCESLENTNTVDWPADKMQEHVFDCHSELRQLRARLGECRKTRDDLIRSAGAAETANANLERLKVEHEAVRAEKRLLLKELSVRNDPDRSEFT